jgi:histidyl-tRNA synthetase
VEASISGFLELLPEQELVQQQWMAIVRRQFELHGFGPLQTRSVERVEDLVNQGDTEKEIYGLHRLAAPAGDKEAKLALHYDLTVPFARYVKEHQNDLVFPFRRYQVQPAWRGERPQLGRYREFIQADADIIGRDELEVFHDADMILMLGETLAKLDCPAVRLLVNNRKLLEGFYRGLGIENTVEALRIVDKLPKIKEAGVREQLAKAGMTSAQVDGCVAISRVESADPEELRAHVAALGVSHPLLSTGLDELCLVLDRCKTRLPGSVVAALHIARGFDYYTGTVVEGVLRDHPTLGSVCSGGRYDNLASTKTALPGMGVSIGITRLVSFMIHLGLLKTPRKSPAQVFVLVHAADQRPLSLEVADKLRHRGIATLVSHSARAYGKQMQQAQRMGIDYVWFPAQPGQAHVVKDITKGEQFEVDIETWKPATP